MPLLHLHRHGILVGLARTQDEAEKRRKFMPRPEQVTIDVHPILPAPLAPPQKGQDAPGGVRAVPAPALPSKALLEAPASAATPSAKK